jgi:beta-glucosidase
MKLALFPFPDRPRLWGVAVSHYQVEGDDPCDWTEWEAAGRTRGEACGAGVGSWERYEEDAGLAASLGANAFRFSVSWSRVEPRRGEFDDAALARYRRFTEHLVGLGLEPVVTLLHYTHPVWFHRETPWTSTASVRAFGRFARAVADALTPFVRLWVVLNEPLVLLLGGFVDGQIPPGLADTRAARRALDHLLAAHAEAAAAIREEVPGSVIAVAHNMMAFAPERPRHPLDRALVRAAHRFYNRGLLEAFATGRWSLWLPPFHRLAGRRDDLPASLDVLGINFYSRLHLRSPGKERLVGDFAYRDRTGLGLTDNGWEIVPEALGPLLREAARIGKPLLVTENGLADAADSRRASFLRAHAEALGSAIAAGVPVHGFFHWSLLDNYEWLDGFGPKFGLFEVDRRTFDRRPRPSAAVFRELGRSFLGDGAAAAAAQESVHI